MRKWRWWQKGILLLGVLVIGLGVAAWIYLQPYEPNQRALEAMKTDDEVQVNENGDWIAFLPEQKRETSVLFYPGGLVEPESYAPLAKRLADEGFSTYILKMPLHLAVLSQDKALQVIEQDSTQQYVIGGHSLGGAMATRFANEHADLVEGVFLLAAYPDEGGNLSGTDLSFISISGTKDGVMNQEKFEGGQLYVPEDAQYESIKGANHAQFGHYGPQDGDLEATISNEEQLDHTATLIVDWLQ